MPFRTPLLVRHDVDEEWELLEPLVFEGRDDFFVMRREFTTDFASIPRAVRWLFDTAGANSEPGVLHDAVWRESKRTDAEPRVDPWDADGLFRRALRESGRPAITRALMWIAVRLVAVASGRFGAQGPRLPVKVGQIVGMTAVGAVSVGAPTLIALVGRAFYLVIEWIVTLIYWPFERAKGFTTNLPWYPGSERKGSGDEADTQASPRELLVIIPIDSDAGRELATRLGKGNSTVITDEEIDELPAQGSAAY